MRCWATPLRHPPGMKIAIRALAFSASLLPLAALGQSAPANLPAQSVYGRMGIPGDTGPGQAIPFAVLGSQLLGGAQTANTVYAGPSSGPVASAAFRALVGADLPVPGASSLGGVQSKTCSTSNWFNTLSTAGVFGCSQPNFTDLAGSISAAQLINPTASTLGGVKSLAAISHNFLTSISTGGQPTQAQPACADVSDSSVGCNAARGQLPGETSTGSAAAGNVGEYIESVIVNGSAVSLVTATAKTITSISLTAGDWDVSGQVSINGAGTAAITFVEASISLTTNTVDTTAGRDNRITSASNASASVPAFALPVGPVRFSLSGTTSIFLVGNATFTNAASGWGILRARRVR